MKANIKGVLNLNYIEVENVPVQKNERHGHGVHADIMQQIQLVTARSILLDGIPLRGEEVRFLRNVLGLSQRELGRNLGYSDVAILKWERGKAKRLDPVNEVALRALMAGLLNVKLPGTFEGLRGRAKTPRRLVIDFAEASKMMKAA